MRSIPTPAETFLVDFHDRNPGVTSRAFMSLRANRSGEVAASSYHFLSALVPRDVEQLSLLDVACGDGHLLSLVSSIRNLPATLVGIDISDGELSAARRRLGRRAALVRARAQSIPLPEASMDYVLCHMALMLMDDLDSVIGEVRRVLRTGGVFSFIVGAGPPSSPALEMYLARLRDLRQFHGSSIPLPGDRRLANHVGTRALLDHRFDNVVSDEILIARRYEPAELWTWFEGTYDLDGIPAQERAAMRSGYIADLSPVCAADGRVEFVDRLRQVRATAA